MTDEIKILAVGNSFAQDTMEYTADLLHSLGVENFKMAYLYIGGCSLNRHYHNVAQNLFDYAYFTNTGTGWVRREGFSIAGAVQEENWDFISLQHGTKDKSRYTSPESYEKLSPLVKAIRTLSQKEVKIAFNMAWVPEPESTHHEILSYGGNQLLMYENLVKLTEEQVAPKVDVVSPVGTAVQNARGRIEKKLTRDNFHLSYDLGRYIAALTFLGALCKIDVQRVNWCPDGVTKEERELAKKAALSALRTPFALLSFEKESRQRKLSCGVI